MEETLVDGTGTQIIKAIAALIFVVGLMSGLALLLKKLGLSGALPVKQGEKRLKIIEVLPLDARRKLAIIERDDQQHLIILGANSETVIETSISPPDNKDNA